MALNNLNNPFSPQPATNLDLGDGAMIQVQYSGPAQPQYGGHQLAGAGQCVGGVVTNGGTEPGPDIRSRHSSAGSDGAQQCHARSAPMSPFNDAGGHVRQRHVSAGHVPASGSSSHTIHYRPPTEFEAGHYTSFPGPGAAANNGDLSHHSSYRNTPIPQVGSDLGLVLASFMSKLFQNEAEAEFTGLMNTTDEIVTAVADTKIKDDDIDLALDALRNCDTDFIKFDEVFIFILYICSLICYLHFSNH